MGYKLTIGERIDLYELQELEFIANPESVVGKQFIAPPTEPFKRLMFIPLMHTWDWIKEDGEINPLLHEPESVKKIGTFIIKTIK